MQQELKPRRCVQQQNLTSSHSLSALVSSCAAGGGSAASIRRGGGGSAAVWMKGVSADKTSSGSTSYEDSCSETEQVGKLNCSACSTSNIEPGENYANIHACVFLLWCCPTPYTCALSIEYSQAILA